MEEVGADAVPMAVEGTSECEGSGRDDRTRINSPKRPIRPVRKRSSWRGDMLIVLSTLERSDIAKSQLFRDERSMCIGGEECCDRGDFVATGGMATGDSIYL